MFFFLGHTKHEMTSYSCMEALFKFFEQQYQEFSKGLEESEAKKPRADL